MSKARTMRGKKTGILINSFCYTFLFIFHITFSGHAFAADSSPPAKVVKLIFIHHSCGENWLADEHGRLGIELGKNNYFVSDTNYGWGPDGIGDRTDITDWPEWFRSDGSKIYLKALYDENEKHSSYTRNLKDPGGENRVIMFKSCFPNSNLEGPPNAPPSRGEGLSVANAKAIYNELLEYFRTRPDKLFIAVTAPPLLDKAYSVNARAFNRWLVKEWLSGYKGNNVAVFDFYNILTGPDNHHRIRKGKIEYVTDRGGNTLYYPTGSDEHPSKAGNQKATREFIPLLNYYYKVWAPGAPQSPPPGESHPDNKEEISEEKPTGKKDTIERASRDSESYSDTLEPGEIIDDFETPDSHWVVFSDEGKDTRLSFQRDTKISHESKGGMRIEYDIAPDSWATCSLVYPQPRDLTKTSGIEVHLHAERSGRVVTIVAYQGASSDELKHFEYKAKIGKKGAQAWQQFKIPWDKFVQPPWQGDRKVRFDPAKSMGFAFAFVSPEKGRNKGVIWVDDLKFLEKVR